MFTRGKGTVWATTSLGTIRKSPSWTSVVPSSSVSYSSSPLSYSLVTLSLQPLHRLRKCSILSRKSQYILSMHSVKSKKRTCAWKAFKRMERFLTLSPNSYKIPSSKLARCWLWASARQALRSSVGSLKTQLSSMSWFPAKRSWLYSDFATSATSLMLPKYYRLMWWFSSMKSLPSATEWPMSTWVVLTRISVTLSCWCGNSRAEIAKSLRLPRKLISN